MPIKPIHVIGGGLAGSEAAWQIARRGVPVVLHEMRPVRSTVVHKTAGFAELVCSNSFRSDDAQGSAIGLLHAEMRRLSSLVMGAADDHMLPAAAPSCPACWSRGPDGPGQSGRAYRPVIPLDAVSPDS